MITTTKDVYERIVRKNVSRLDHEFTKGEAMLCLQPLTTEEVQYHLDLLVNKGMLSCHDGFYSIVCTARKLARGRWV